MFFKKKPILLALLFGLNSNTLCPISEQQAIVRSSAIGGLVGLATGIIYYAGQADNAAFDNNRALIGASIGIITSIPTAISCFSVLRKHTPAYLFIEAQKFTNQVEHAMATSQIFVSNNTAEDLDAALIAELGSPWFLILAAQKIDGLLEMMAHALDLLASVNLEIGKDKQSQQNVTIREQYPALCNKAVALRQRLFNLLATIKRHPKYGTQNQLFELYGKLIV